jgi:redox-sensitive bicupin YhaK (pirin superfamily)
VTVIAGEYQDTKGPAVTRSPINLWRARLVDGAKMEMSLPASDTAAVFVMEGSIRANGTEVGEHQLVLFNHDGDDIELLSDHGAHLLVLSGTPLGEPIVSYGPFVMNTRDEIIDAIDDFNAGKFGELE